MPVLLAFRKWKQEKVQGHPWLHSHFEARLGYIGPCQKKKKEEEETEVILVRLRALRVLNWSREKQVPCQVWFSPWVNL